MSQQTHEKFMLWYHDRFGDNRYTDGGSALTTPKSRRRLRRKLQNSRRRQQLRARSSA